jgi:SdpC family antimicrobial peptide
MKESKNNKLNLRGKLFNSIISTALIIAIAVVGIPFTASAQSSSQSFTGEEVFRGVLFGEDPVAKLFPDIWASDEVAEQLNTKEKIKAWEALKEQVISHIKTNDPAFMDRFGVEMQSGSHLRIQNALTESSDKITTALKALGAMTPDGEFNSSYQGSMACSAVVVCVVTVAVAAWKWVAVVDVAAVAYVAAVAIAIWRWRYTYSSRSSFSDDPSASQLFRESLVDSIAEKLDATP